MDSNPILEAFGNAKTVRPGPCLCLCCSVLQRCKLCGAMLQTSGAMLQTSGAMLQTSGAMLQTSGAMLQTSGAMLQTSGAMLQHVVPCGTAFPPPPGPLCACGPLRSDAACCAAAIHTRAIATCSGRRAPSPEQPSVPSGGVGGHARVRVRSRSASAHTTFVCWLFVCMFVCLLVCLLVSSGPGHRAEA